MIKEEWKVLDFIEYYNYAVSNFGRVKSLNYNRTGEERILKPFKCGIGYLTVRLYKDGKAKQFKVHRLVAEAFLPNPDNLPFINHKDENPLNNCLSNIEWCTPKYNVNYGSRNKKVSKLLTNGKRSKTVNQYTLDGLLIASYPSTMEAERQTGYDHGNISYCCNGKRNYCGGYIWRFA